MAISFSGNNEMHNSEVLALNHKWAPRSRQSQFLYWGNVMVQNLQYEKNIRWPLLKSTKYLFLATVHKCQKCLLWIVSRVIHSHSKFLNANAQVRNVPILSPSLHTFDMSSNPENCVPQRHLGAIYFSPIPVTPPAAMFSLFLIWVTAKSLLDALSISATLTVAWL